MRKKILALLETLWDKYPNQRLGQLLENYVFTDGKRGDLTSVRLFHQQDELTLKKLEELFSGFSPKEEAKNDVNIFMGKGK